MLMSKKCIDYFAPKIGVHIIEVEQGFALSNPNNESMPEIGGEKEEIDW